RIGSGPKNIRLPQSLNGKIWYSSFGRLDCLSGFVLFCQCGLYHCLCHCAGVGFCLQTFSGKNHPAISPSGRGKGICAVDQPALSGKISFADCGRSQRSFLTFQFSILIRPDATFPLMVAEALFWITNCLPLVDLPTLTEPIPTCKS